jgi:NAD(P)H dehydrogenase (quinone)
VEIGMVVFSHTGNTHSVAQKLRQKLAAKGHDVTYDRLKVVGGFRPAEMIEQPDLIRFEALPDLERYDRIIFGSPVQGGSISAAMIKYLGQLPSLAGKEAACLVTEAFPFGWMGGNRAIRQMVEICEAKGATVRGSGLVNWMRPTRKWQIERVTDSLTGVFA